mmetsp:Transcript_43029/g.131006  ORF Transcript_43029/g.131006 Transcript_43029/m.131006 type:complete len:233 (-) Transcript_43029:1760-2458(-)
MALHPASLRHAFAPSADQRISINLRPPTRIYIRIDSDDVPHGESLLSLHPTTPVLLLLPVTKGSRPRLPLPDAREEEWLAAGRAGSAPQEQVDGAGRMDGVAIHAPHGPVRCRAKIDRIAAVADPVALPFSFYLLVAFALGGWGSSGGGRGRKGTRHEQRPCDAEPTGRDGIEEGPPGQTVVDGLGEAENGFHVVQIGRGNNIRGGYALPRRFLLGVHFSSAIRILDDSSAV